MSVVSAVPAVAAVMTLLETMTVSIGLGEAGPASAYDATRTRDERYREVPGPCLQVVLRWRATGRSVVQVSDEPVGHGVVGTSMSPFLIWSAYPLISSWMSWLRKSPDVA